MNRKLWSKILRQANRFAESTGPVQLMQRTGFSIEITPWQSTVIRVGDFDQIEQIKDDLESLYIWLWSAKDYLIALLHDRGKTKAAARRMVEDYIDQHPELCLVADVANTAKHAELTRSRTGKFAKIGPYVTSAPILLGWESPKTVQRRIKEAGHASIVIVDEHDAAIGDAAEVASKALSTWQAFVDRHRLGG